MPSSSMKRFELPVLGPLDSLTKGTDIPPPPDSPILEENKPPVAAVNQTPSTQHTESPSSAASKTSKTSYTNENVSPKSNHQEPPVSPTSTKPSSIRRFLSRKSLNQSYQNGNNVSSESLSSHRPESPATFSTKTNNSSRRKSGTSWLKRLVSGGDKSYSSNKRASTVFESTTEQENGSRSRNGSRSSRILDQSQSPPPAKRQNGGPINGNGNGYGVPMTVRKVSDMGPPPPKLPELNQFKAKVDENTGSLGGADMFANIGK